MSKRKNSSQRRLERVRAAFDPEMLKRICEMPQSEFGEYADKFDLGVSYGWRGAINEDFYYYKDNGSPVLFVAHLDHVQDDGTCTITTTNGELIALSGALDDRLGAYVGLELLPKLGITVDILLTTNEERGASTARDFVTDKSYNWMIEFDRGGTDVVMYQYETMEYRALVRESGAQVGNGSYSDIADLEDLGCAGFNWGVGYYDYHSKRSHAWLEDTFRMVAKFLKFYASNAATYLPHDRSAKRFSFYGSYTGTSYGGYAASRVGDSVVEDEDLTEEDKCPRCDSDLDSWRCCNACGYGIPELTEQEIVDAEIVLSEEAMAEIAEGAMADDPEEAVG